jgi:hypothetical protein
VAEFIAKLLSQEESGGGGGGGGAAAVVNDQLLGVREFPAKSFIPLVTAAV